jgi:gamma-glutamyltranspeptidase/glutathione hydrolase
MIVAPQPLAAEAEGRVLDDGGNAVDAAVTTAFVQAVIDPQMCGISGSGGMLAYEASACRTSVLEFHARAGSLVREGRWEDRLIRESADRYGHVLRARVNDAGYESVGVPGTVAGLDEALRRFGSISWPEALQPAIAFARHGFPVSAADAHARSVERSSHPGDRLHLQQLPELLRPASGATELARPR